MGLQPFSVTQSFATPQCPQCGATGSYDLLVQRVCAIQEAWAAAGQYPDTNTDRAAIERAIDGAMAAIGIEPAP